MTDTMVFSGRDHISIHVPLCLFDCFKEKLQKNFDTPYEKYLDTEEGAKTMAEFKKALSKAFGTVGEELMSSLYHRWELMDMGIDVDGEV